MTGRRAFTLIEIMVVVALVGLLLSVAVPALRHVLLISSIKQAETDLAMLSTAIEKLAWDTGKWPYGTDRTSTQNPEVWDLRKRRAGLVATDGRFPHWKGPYISRIPTDPWGQDYFFDPDYRVEGKTRVVVGSFGPNQIGRNRYDDDDIYKLLK